MAFHRFESFPASSRAASRHHSERRAESSKCTDNAIQQPHGMGVGYSFSNHENARATGSRMLDVDGPSPSRFSSSDPRTHGEETAMLGSPLKRGFQYICDNFIPSLGSLDADLGVHRDDGPSRQPRGSYAAPGAFPGMCIDDSDEEPLPAFAGSNMLHATDSPSPSKPASPSPISASSKITDEAEGNPQNQVEKERGGARPGAEQRQDKKGRRWYENRRQHDAEYRERLMREAEEERRRRRDEARSERQKQDERERETADPKRKEREGQSEQRRGEEESQRGSRYVDRDLEKILQDFDAWSAKSKEMRTEPDPARRIKVLEELSGISGRIDEWLEEWKANREERTRRWREARRAEVEERERARVRKEEEEVRRQAGSFSSRTKSQPASRARFHPYSSSKKRSPAHDDIHDAASGPSQPSAVHSDPKCRPSSSNSTYTSASSLDISSPGPNSKKRSKDPGTYLEWYDSEWTACNTSSSSSSLTFSDIPWPVIPFPQSPQEVTAAAVQSFMKQCRSDELLPKPVTTKENRITVKKELLNWHPDKFSTRILQRVADPTDREVISRAADVVQKALISIINEPDGVGN
ncbi:hypothetical protein A7U60_g4776 [Sanghuangporus baumii]|uniref:Uncharacterized protein n=1 Tax=Sanghuangporus baumii TaxID=108892 RepID=A0A9Q5HYP7_SANBA|nr:hypothetical protein A7U60_g4776 [Sanghuangporus baumii]